MREVARDDTADGARRETLRRESDRREEETARRWGRAMTNGMRAGCLLQYRTRASSSREWPSAIQWSSAKGEEEDYAVKAGGRFWKRGRAWASTVSGGVDLLGLTGLGLLAGWRGNKTTTFCYRLVVWFWLGWLGWVGVFVNRPLPWFELLVLVPVLVRAMVLLRVLHESCGAGDAVRARYIGAVAGRKGEGRGRVRGVRGVLVGVCSRWWENRADV